MKYLIALFLVLQVSSSKAETFNDSTFGCMDRDDMVRIFKIEDGATLLYNLIQIGSCKRFEKEEQVMVEINNSDGACVIPMSGTNCFWIAPAFLKP